MYFEKLRERVLDGPRKLAHLYGLSTPVLTSTSFNRTLPEKDIRSTSMSLRISGAKQLGKQSLQVDFFFAGLLPTFLNAGISALNMLFDPSQPPPDVVLFNMGAWWQSGHRVAATHKVC